MKPTYRKLWAVNLFDVVRFDLGPQLQGKMKVAKLENAYNLYIIEICCLSLKLC